MKDIMISVTEEYEKLVPFFIENELEFSEEEPVPTDLVKCWKAEEDGKLAGACVLAKREGEFIIDGIATAPEHRGKKLGAALLERAIEETREKSGKSIFLVARAPGFFRKYGFVTIDAADAPNFFECLTCPQYMKSCFPEVMRLDLQEELQR